MDWEETKRLLAAFAREGVQYVLIGSMGMAVLGVVRATQDIDFFVEPSEDNIERLRRALKSLYPDPSIDEITASDLAGAYPAIQYVPPHGSFSIDLLARLGEAFGYADIEFETVDVDGIAVRVATARMLYKMKKDTVRPRDQIDAAELKRRFNLPED